MVELADALQGDLELPVVAQPLLDHGLLFGSETELLSAPAGIADGQDPDRVALSAGADGTAEAATKVAEAKRNQDIAVSNAEQEAASVRAANDAKIAEADRDRDVKVANAK